MQPIKAMAGGNSGVVVSLSVLPGSYVREETSPTDAFCSVSYNNNGSWQAFDNDGSIGNWYNPTTGGIGSSYWIRWTNTSGTLSSGTAGSWLALSGGQTFGVEFTAASGSKTCTGTVEISSNASGTPVVASGSVTISAVVAF